MALCLSTWAEQASLIEGSDEQRPEGAKTRAPTRTCKWLVLARAWRVTGLVARDQSQPRQGLKC